MWNRLRVHGHYRVSTLSHFLMNHAALVMYESLLEMYQLLLPVQLKLCHQSLSQQEESIS